MTQAMMDALELVRAFTPAEKLRLVTVILSDVEQTMEPKRPGAARRWRGAYAGTGPVPTEEDIREIRREAWPWR